MSAEPFVLDAVENPHPRMRAGALEYRRRATIIRGALDRGAPPTADMLGPLVAWSAYREAMCDATGCTATEIEAWLDREPPTPTVDVIETL